MGGHLGMQNYGLHAHRQHGALGKIHYAAGYCVGTHALNQGQQVNWVVGVSDDDLFRTDGILMQLLWHKPGS